MVRNNRCIFYTRIYLNDLKATQIRGLKKIASKVRERKNDHTAKFILVQPNKCLHPVPNSSLRFLYHECSFSKLLEAFTVE